MSGFKEKRGKSIDKSLLELLNSENKPVSTRDISIKTKLSWHTVINHCLKLQMAGKIEGYKLSNLNVWFIKK